MPLQFQRSGAARSKRNGKRKSGGTVKEGGNTRRRTNVAHLNSVFPRSGTNENEITNLMPDRNECGNVHQHDDRDKENIPFAGDPPQHRPSNRSRSDKGPHANFSDMETQPPSNYEWTPIAQTGNGNENINREEIGGEKEARKSICVRTQCPEAPVMDTDPRPNRDNAMANVGPINMAGNGMGAVRLFLSNMQTSLLHRLDELDMKFGCQREVILEMKEEIKDLLAVSARNGPGALSASKLKKVPSHTSKWAFKEVVEKENRTVRHQVAQVFHATLLSEVLSESVSYLMEHTWSLGTTIAHTHLAMSAFLYGHQKNSTKEAFGKGLARVHCDFKFRFVRKVFAAAHFKMSAAQRLKITPGDSGKNGEAAVPIVQSALNNGVRSTSPVGLYWLDPRYVNRRTIRKTRLLVETKAKPEKSDIHTAKGRESLYIAHNVYSMATEFLRESRVHGKKRFYEDIGFALRPWETSRGIPVEFGQPILAFKYPEHDYNQADYIACAMTQEVPNANVWNMEELQKIISSRLELDVLLTHSVLVGDGLLKNGGQKKGFQPAEYKKMHRSVNLAKIAINFHVAFTQAESVEGFLSSHAASLRTVYRTALLFRTFVIDVINGRSHLDMPSTLKDIDHPNRSRNIRNVPRKTVLAKEHESDGEIEFAGEIDETISGKNRSSSPPNCPDADSDCSQETESFQRGSTVVRLRIRDFLPGISKQKDILDSQILRMSPAKFYKLCASSPTPPPNETDCEALDDRSNETRANTIFGHYGDRIHRDGDWDDCSDDDIDFDHLLYVNASHEK